MAVAGSMKNSRDPYEPELWPEDVVDIELMVHDISAELSRYSRVPTCFEDEPQAVQYDDRPPEASTKLVRRGRDMFESQAEADRWAEETHRVVERRHTARFWCWRVYV
jgi:hypothetical protein